MNAPLVPFVRVLRGRYVLAHTDALRAVYTDAFSSAGAWSASPADGPRSPGLPVELRGSPALTGALTCLSQLRRLPRTVKP
ncbi:hypothetical protein GCM10010297_28170 [Streptomyces malachitofuscus]|nr:hypothetical protein GCM10010297_28170 [Streptomyces malachitofuscus]